MALIRCPNCDTLHDLDGALFANGPRKVRCASCRDVWEAVDPESNQKRSIPLPVRDPPAEAGPTANLSKPPAGSDPPEAPQIDFDALDISQEPEPSPAQPLVQSEASKLGPAVVVADTAVKPSEADAELEAAMLRRQESRKKKLESTKKPPKPARRAAAYAGLVLAAGIGTVATLVIFRHEAVRIAPETAMMFDAIGLGVNTRGLDVADIRSRIVKDDVRETLEITGSIVNITKSAQKIPVLRLSIRNAAGQEIYVWTASADQPELGPGEKTEFRRRLASPPAESHAVMVRFVAKDDIVAAIR